MASPYPISSTCSEQGAINAPEIPFFRQVRCLPNKIDGLPGTGNETLIVPKALKNHIGRQGQKVQNQPSQPEAELSGHTPPVRPAGLNERRGLKERLRLPLSRKIL